MIRNNRLRRVVNNQVRNGQIQQILSFCIFDGKLFLKFLHFSKIVSFLVELNVVFRVPAPDVDVTETLKKKWQK